MQLLISGPNTIGANVAVASNSAPTLGNIDDNNAVFGGTIARPAIRSPFPPPGLLNTLTFAGNITGTRTAPRRGPDRSRQRGLQRQQHLQRPHHRQRRFARRRRHRFAAQWNRADHLLGQRHVHQPGPDAPEPQRLGRHPLGFSGNGTTLTIGSGAYAGAITDSTSGSNLVKNTTGLLDLSGPSNLQGTTTVQAGACSTGPPPPFPPRLRSVARVIRSWSPPPAAVGLQVAGLQATLLPNLNPASNGTLVVTPATAADTINLTGFSALSLRARSRDL